MFLDGVQGGPRDALHILLANEMVRASDAIPNPDVNNFIVDDNEYRIIDLETLVAMKLNSFRDKDRTHLRDMLGVGLIDETWVAQVPPSLAPRLQQLLNDPNG